MRRAFGLLLLVILAACSGGSSTRDVTAAEFGDEWPFTVEAGTLSCDGSAALFTAEGTTYGLNGTALSRDYRRVDPIWADNPDIPDAKVSIGGMIEAAQALCE